MRSGDTWRRAFAWAGLVAGFAVTVYAAFHLIVNVMATDWSFRWCTIELGCSETGKTGVNWFGVLVLLVVGLSVILASIYVLLRSRSH